MAPMARGPPGPGQRHHPGTWRSEALTPHSTGRRGAVAGALSLVFAGTAARAFPRTDGAPGPGLPARQRPDVARASSPKRCARSSCRRGGGKRPGAAGAIASAGGGQDRCGGRAHAALRRGRASSPWRPAPTRASPTTRARDFAPIAEVRRSLRLRRHRLRAGERPRAYLAGRRGGARSHGHLRGRNAGALRRRHDRRRGRPERRAVHSRSTGEAVAAVLNGSGPRDVRLRSAGGRTCGTGA